MIGKLLKGLLGSATTAEQSAPVASAHPNRVHIFYGTFGSELEATDYCLTPAAKNAPTPLMADLPDATVNTQEIEIIFGPARIKAAAPMLQPDPDGLLARIGGDNTVIMLAEAAFGGTEYRLNDTPRLRYAGPYDVN